VTRPLKVRALGEGWTSTSTHSAATEIHAGFIRRVEMVRISFTHELGGRAEALFTAPVGAGVYRLREARAWVMNTDPVLERVRGHKSPLTEPACITGEELRVLVTDEDAVQI
jgi:hypothetical protein